jgi:hypothetical protein
VNDTGEADRHQPEATSVRYWPPENCLDLVGQEAQGCRPETSWGKFTYIFDRRRHPMKKFMFAVIAAMWMIGLSSITFADEMGKMKGEMKSETEKTQGEMKGKAGEMKVEMKGKAGEMKGKGDKMKGEMKGDMGEMKDAMKGGK